MAKVKNKIATNNKIREYIVKIFKERRRLYKAGLRPEVKGRDHTPPAGGSCQTAGEHDGRKDCGKRIGGKINSRGGKLERITVVCEHIINGNQCKKNNEECVFTQY